MAAYTSFMGASNKPPQIISFRDEKYATGMYVFILFRGSCMCFHASGCTCRDLYKCKGLMFRSVT